MNPQKLAKSIKLELLINELLIKLDKKYSELNDSRFINLMSKAENEYKMPFIGYYCNRYNKIMEKYDK